MSKAQKKAKVHDLIDQLGLRNASRTVIGDEGHGGISGGERRRVSVGTDIIHDPSILFLDEPTSGLDSMNAFMLVKILKQIAQSGGMVIMSIHQPGYKIDSLLDKVIFLSQGQTVYSGSPTNLPCFLSDSGNPITLNENHTEFILDIIHDHELDTSLHGSETSNLVEFGKHWQKTQHQQIAELNSLQQSLEDKPVSVSKSNHSIFNEILILSKRSILNSKRMPEEIATKVGVALITGFIFSTTYWKLDDSQKGVQERFALLAITFSSAFYICTIAFPVFIQEQYIFQRETTSNTYRVSSYVIADSIVSLPTLVFLSLSFGATLLSPAGLSGGILGFLFFFTITFASFWAGSSFVTFLSGVIPSVMPDYTIVLSYIGFFFFFSGFFVNADRIPSYFMWLNYISLGKYPYKAMLIKEFDDPRKCFVRPINMFHNTILEEVTATTKIKWLKTLNGMLGANIGDSNCIAAGPDIFDKVE